MPVSAGESPALLQGDAEDPVSDQWLEAFVIVDDDGRPIGTIEDDDAVLIFNFRAGGRSAPEARKTSGPTQPQKKQI